MSLLLNKTDLVSPAQLDTVETLLRRLNPTAKLHPDRSRRRGHRRGTGDRPLRSDRRARGHPAGMRRSPTGTPRDRGIRHQLDDLRSDRPFHPQRLGDALAQTTRVLRSKGFCWIASRPTIAAIWSQAGPNLVIEPAQYWSNTDITPGQEIVFISVKLDRDKAASPCWARRILTDDEVAEAESAWLGYPDPLPAWGVTQQHSH